MQPNDGFATAALTGLELPTDFVLGIVQNSG